MADTLRQLGLDRTRARKGAVRPEINPSQIRGLLADLGTGIGLPFIDAASQAAQGNYGQAAVSGLLDAPPVKMAGMALAPLIGMVRKAAPMDEALRIAQKNAAKPVSEGGLGLPPDNTPMDRARAMGFDWTVYHGTQNDFPAFDESKFRKDVQYMPGVFTAENPNLAANFGDYILPLLQKRGVTVVEKRAARATGKKVPVVDTIRDAERGILVTNKPENIRSRFAAFDPARINENNLLASLAALGISIPVMRGLLQEEEMQ